MTAAAPYALGHSEAELERLQLQASVIGSVTSRLIRECGITGGWSVLEVGCGAGDVTLLLAEAVGSKGKVLAFDREAKAIDTTRARVTNAGYTNVDYAVGDRFDFPGHAPFDAVFGRYVLIHQADPVAMLRDAAGVVKPDGVVAFHELPLDPRAKSYSIPKVKLFASISDTVGTAYRNNVQSPDVADEFVRVFGEAGLPSPTIIWECLAGDWQSPAVNYLLSSFASIKRFAEAGDPHGEFSGDPKDLLQKVQAELRAAKAQVMSRPQVCAWSVRR